jgi:hypothetical protein
MVVGFLCGGSAAWSLHDDIVLAVLSTATAALASEDTPAQDSLEDNAVFRGDTDTDERLARLARMTHLSEVTPWMRPIDPGVSQFGQDLITATGRCEPQETALCVTQAFRYLDAWYADAS